MIHTINTLTLHKAVFGRNEKGVTVFFLKNKGVEDFLSTKKKRQRLSGKFFSKNLA